MDTRPAYFEMTDVNEQQFFIRLDEQEKIDHARRILDGSEKSRIHIQGTVVKDPAIYNPSRKFHLEPATIDFFENAIEVCDAAIDFVQTHPDALNDAVSAYRDPAEF